jgi:superfamily II DNA or RNA helicase
MAARKIDLTERLTRALVERGHKKLVVFFERIESADTVGEDVARQAAFHLRERMIQAEPIWCKVYHSELGSQARAAVLGEFRRVGPSALLACRSLDEGLDIPQVDAAILAASTQAKRQRIQRIGRTLRRGHGNKRPLIITLYAQGTNDENVTSEDRETFEGVATIHNETDQTCAVKVGELM